MPLPTSDRQSPEGASERNTEPWASVDLSEAGLGRLLDDAREREELASRLAEIVERRGSEGELSEEIALEIVREAISIAYPDRSIPPLLIDAAAAWIAAACWRNAVSRTRLEAIWADARRMVSP